MPKEPVKDTIFIRVALNASKAAEPLFQENISYLEGSKDEEGQLHQAQRDQGQPPPHRPQRKHRHPALGWPQPIEV